MVHFLRPLLGQNRSPLIFTSFCSTVSHHLQGNNADEQHQLSHTITKSDLVCMTSFPFLNCFVGIDSFRVKNYDLSSLIATYWHTCGSCALPVFVFFVF